MAEDAKTILRKIKLCDAHINSRLEEVERLRDMATHVTTAFGTEPVSGGFSGDKIGNAVAKIVDLEEQIGREIYSFVDLKRKVGKVLDGMEDPKHIQILHKRYFEYKKWEQIACEMGCSYQWVCKMHGWALQAFEKTAKKQKISFS